MHPSEVRIHDPLARPCECEDYFPCQWHYRLRQGEPRGEVERDMEEELARRHIFLRHALNLDTVPAEVQEFVGGEEVVQ